MSLYRLTHLHVTTLVELGELMTLCGPHAERTVVVEALEEYVTVVHDQRQGRSAGLNAIVRMRQSPSTSTSFDSALVRLSNLLQWTCGLRS